MSTIMRRWELDSVGLDTMILRDAPIPSIQDGEILIKVSAVSLNFRDKLVVDGLAGTNFPLPFTPGSDMAGTVSSVGAGVTRFSIGDRVLSTFLPEWIDGPPIGNARIPPHRTLGGFFNGVLCEYLVLHEDWAVHAPRSLTDVQASTLPCAGLTAWFALVERGGLKAGDIVLVEGTGGVALFSLQIAKAHEAQVIVVSGSDTKLAKAKILGADHGINRNNDDWLVSLLNITGNYGADHIVELVGGSHLAKAIQASAVGGRIYQIGFREGFEATVPLAPLMFKNVNIVGIGSGHRRAMERFVAAVDWIGIKPVIDATYSLEEVPVAFKHLERGPFGKIVITMQ